METMYWLHTLLQFCGFIFSFIIGAYIFERLDYKISNSNIEITNGIIIGIAFVSSASILISFIIFMYILNLVFRV